MMLAAVETSDKADPVWSPDAHNSNVVRTGKPPTESVHAVASSKLPAQPPYQRFFRSPG